MKNLTNDIPNVSEEATKNLDENGLIRVGALIKEGDILIGKITPKGESEPSPEEKLLRAIFGDKAGDVKDASLKATPSKEGVVVAKQLFVRRKKDRANKADDKTKLTKLEKDHLDELDKLRAILLDKLYKLLSGKTSAGVQNVYYEDVISKGTKFTLKKLSIY